MKPRPASGRRLRLTLAVALALTTAVALAGCAASEDSTVTFPPASIGPDLTVSPAVSLTRSSLEIALRNRALSLTDAQVPFRPAESPRLTDAPRAVYQVVLPKDPTGGYLVVYEFPDPDLANQAAQEQAQYLATGPGRVQSSLETVDVIRVVGSTVILYSWIPGEARDPTAAGIQPALETLGLGIPVPS
jgi:hypothetical protein